MIDLANEDVISFTEATKRLPARRRGKRPHVATLYRWSNRGCRGVKLETIQVGGTSCTSVEALQRFCERLSTGDAEPHARTSRQRQRDIKRAENELEAAGV